MVDGRSAVAECHSSRGYFAPFFSLCPMAVLQSRDCEMFLFLILEHFVFRGAESIKQI